MRPEDTKKQKGNRQKAAYLPSSREVSNLELLEREREFLSEELHDTVSQSLGGLSILISFLQSRLKKGQPIQGGDLRELQSEIYKASEELKLFTFILMPKNLQGGGLILALSDLIDFTTQFRPCEFECKKPVFVSSPERAVALFRIAHEALRCAAQMQITKTIKVKLTQAKSEIVLEVSPFPGQRSGGKFSPRLIELYCKQIGGEVVFKERTQSLMCRTENI